MIYLEFFKGALALVVIIVNLIAIRQLAKKHRSLSAVIKYWENRH